MDKKVIKRSDLVVKNTTVQITNDLIESEKRIKELKEKKQKHAPKINVQKDPNGQIAGVEVICSCGEVINIALDYNA